jgi:tripartite-type tricarboxylate transporter receptor subunit TctC
MNSMKVHAFAVIAACPLAVFSSAALAADYFAGKTITVEVPAGSGGSYHMYCQMVQHNLARHIPGKPTMIVRNRPGAGGLVSASYMANVAKKDGTEIAMIAPGTLTIPLIRPTKFDGRKFNFLGSTAARSAAIWVWHTKGITSLEDLKTKPVKLAASSFTSSASIFPRMLNKLLGTKMEIVTGYKGGGAMNLAIERGEAEGRWNYRSGFVAAKPGWMKDKKLVPVVATGPRDPLMKGVPHIREFFKDGSVEQKLYDMYEMNFLIGQGFYAPPGVNPEALKILRTAFAKMVADPQTLKMVNERRLEWAPISAEDVHKELDKGFSSVTPEVVAALKAVFEKKTAAK